MLLILGDSAKHERRFCKLIRFVVGVILWASLGALPPVACGVENSPTVEKTYPHLFSGILASARLADLGDGMLVSVEELRITEADLTEFISRYRPEMQEQLKKNILFVVEQIALEKILLNEAAKDGHTTKGRSTKDVIQSFLNVQTANVTVTDAEAKSFFVESKEMVRDAPFEQVKESIKGYLLQQKKQEAAEAYIQALGQRTDVRIDSEWVKAKSDQAKADPVYNARNSGKATMVEFGATGCVPCDMMQPILENLKKKYKDRLNVIFVNVREEQILAGRYGIRNIPLQAFYDAAGKQVFMHQGFYPEDEITKKLRTFGVN